MVQLETVCFDLIVQAEAQLVLGLQVDVVVIVVILVVGSPEDGAGDVVGVEDHHEGPGVGLATIYRGCGLNLAPIEALENDTIGTRMGVTNTHPIFTQRRCP